MSASNDSRSPIGRVADALARAGSKPKTAGMWSCPVPAHHDRNASLHLSEGDGDRVLIHDHGGCSVEQVLAAIGLEMRDLFPQRRGVCVLDPPRSTAHLHRSPESRGGSGTSADPPESTRLHTPPESQADSTSSGEAPDCIPLAHPPSPDVMDSTKAIPVMMGGELPNLTLEAYAKAKKLPVSFLRQIGIRQVTYMGGTALRVAYLDEDGVEKVVRFRLRLEKGEGVDDRFRWRTGSKTMLYGIWRLKDVRAAGRVVLVEGESDCHTLWHHAIPALGIPGANTWRPEWAAEHLDGIETVYVVQEPDSAGRALVAKLLATPGLRDRLRIVRLRDAKDPSELHLRDRDGFRSGFEAALASAPLALDEDRAAVEEASREAFTRCEELARDRDILARVVETLRRLGVVGEHRLAKLVFLAVISRFLLRPVSLAVKGPSSGGKSFTVEQTLRLFPDSAYYALTAMSERALAYSDEPLMHRMMVICEAAGMQGELASYMIRSLLSEGRVRYETVEKTAEGLKARLIERPGPTGLIVTTTAVRLHPENETRMLSVVVDDTREQTRRIVTSLAEAPQAAADVEIEQWHRLQEWLAGAEHRVEIPYAKVLAELIDPVAVRLRRDVGLLLNLIRAHAILHQASREHTPDGRIIATLTDYARVRELVADLMGEAVAATVRPAVRETVQAVARILDAGSEAVNVTELADALELDRSAATRRYQAARASGYLQNREERRGRPARIVLGESLPEDRPLLPTVEALGEVVDPDGRAPDDRPWGGNGAAPPEANPDDAELEPAWDLDEVSPRDLWPDDGVPVDLAAERERAAHREGLARAEAVRLHSDPPYRPKPESEKANGSRHPAEAPPCPDPPPRVPEIEDHEDESLPGRRDPRT